MLPCRLLACLTWVQLLPLSSRMLPCHQPTPDPTALRTPPPRAARATRRPPLHVARLMTTPNCMRRQTHLKLSSALGASCWPVTVHTHACYKQLCMLGCQRLYRQLLANLQACSAFGSTLPGGEVHRVSALSLTHTSYSAWSTSCCTLHGCSTVRDRHRLQRPQLL